MAKKLNTPLAAAVGAAFIASASFSGATLAADANPFAATDLGVGYNLADKHGEGKCGEGKCGDDMKKKDKMPAKAKEGKCGEGKCGAEMMKGKGTDNSGQQKAAEKAAEPAGK
ncbi:hypothetical protein [Pseudomaricurvus sp. HS19]|uniref:HvfA family oxazolone/thioamide-modified RiPP metallophore n=1 Tax=Pseudomaricurvus sp. HS19 TaxID=2692626 RepID=UPI00136E33E4|nr:hypothetical protein [Pseudomaricurvus sp. HS19]MYM61993.1 hypothetical protein [Pseudomaricurvus sp. HS19]